MDPFLGGLGPKNEAQPGIIRSTFGSRFQPSFWVAVCAEQRFSGRYRMSGCPTTILQSPCVLTTRRSEAPGKP